MAPLCSQSPGRAELGWPEDDDGFAQIPGNPSDGPISHSVCVCCFPLGLLQSVQHPQIHLGHTVLTRHVSCTLSQATPPSISLVCCRGGYDKCRQGPDPVNELRPGLDNDVLQPLSTFPLQVEDASLSARPSLSLTEYHRQ